MVIIKNDPDSIHEQGFGRLPTTVKTSLSIMVELILFYAGRAIVWTALKVEQM
jgi:hypothetical protein